MKSNNREITKVLVRKGATIGAYAFDTDGTCYQTWLGTGRHDCEGYLLRDGSRYLRLRSADGELQVVAEQDLNMFRGARRVYRKQTTTAPQTAIKPSGRYPLWPTNIRTITPEKRREVRQRLRAAAPTPLPGVYLGTYDEMGSFDIWKVNYSIELRGDQGTVYINRPGRQEQIGPYGAERLAEAIFDAGVETERFITDLRSSGDDALAAFADEVEAAALARGCAELLEDAGIGQEAGAEDQPAPQYPIPRANSGIPPIPTNEVAAAPKLQATRLDDMCLFFCTGPVTVQVLWHDFEMVWYIRLDGYNDYTCDLLSYLPWDATDARIALAVENDLGVRNPTLEILRPDFQKTKDRVEQIKAYRRQSPRESHTPAGADAGGDAGRAK